MTTVGTGSSLERQAMLYVLGEFTESVHKFGRMANDALDDGHLRYREHLLEIHEQYLALMDTMVQRIILNEPRCPIVAMADEDYASWEEYQREEPAKDSNGERATENP